MCYTQLAGLVMFASLAVILQNFWMKSSEEPVQKPNEGRENKTPEKKGICIPCSRRVAFRAKGVQGKSCKNLFNSKCQCIDDTEYKNL